MNKISINAKFIMEFVTPVADYENMERVFKMLSLKFTSEDVTRESMPDYPVAGGRKEIVFRIETKLQDAVHIKWIVNNLK